MATIPTRGDSIVDVPIVDTIRRWFLHFHGTKATDAAVDELYTIVWTPLTALSTYPLGFEGLRRVE